MFKQSKARRKARPELLGMICVEHQSLNKPSSKLVSQKTLAFLFFAQNSNKTLLYTSLTFAGIIGNGEWVVFDDGWYHS